LRCLELRIGVNFGDVIVDGDDNSGDGVNIAAQLEALARSARRLREPLRNR
jgi:adenylate cyclase